MKVFEIVLAFVVPPLAVAAAKNATRTQVAFAFVLWLFGWFPGVVYALSVVSAPPKAVWPDTGRQANPGAERRLSRRAA